MAFLATIFGGGGIGDEKINELSKVQQTGIQDYGRRQNEMLSSLSEARNRKLMEVNKNPQEQFRTGQTELAQMLGQQAAGQGPSLAQAQLAQGQEDALKQQLALAAGARGNLNPALVQKQLLGQAAQSGQQLASQGAILRMQEQQAAQRSLADVLGSGRQQDIGLATADVQAKIQSQAAKDQAAMAVRQAEAQQAQQQAALDQQAKLQAQSIKADLTNKSNESSNKLFGGLLSAGAAAAVAASDKNSKKDVKDGSNDMYDFLDQLSAYKYKYKDPEKPGRGDGDFVSVMAQDLEKSPVGDSMVKDTKDGKMVDYGHGFGAILAAQAELHDRLKKLEKKRG